MKLVATYKSYKEKYPKYVIIIKCGTFYEVYGEEIYILNNIFGYKIKEVGGLARVGFPITSYNKVTNKLNIFKINYLVIDGGVLKNKFSRNRYDYYTSNLDIDNRINKISEKLRLLRDSSKINNILGSIENII